jgi:acyl carrier protein phosphodiesterase
MISDFVKGNKKFDYPLPIQKGITLHRLIDEFTDQHDATKQAKEIFKQELGLYAGAFVDISYDYFLANDINEFKDATSLEQFAINSYKSLDNFIDIFPNNLFMPNFINISDGYATIVINGPVQFLNSSTSISQGFSLSEYINQLNF